MLAKILINIFGLTILVNKVWTQNNENTSTSTIQNRRHPEPFTLPLSQDYFNLEEIQLKKKIYEDNKIDALFFQHAKSTGLQGLEKFDEEKYYLIFRQNILLMNRLYNIYNTTMFSINAYTHYTFDEFTNWFTGFNSTGLREDDVTLFNRSVIQELPPVIDWSDDILLDYFQDTKCKNSYVLSALSNIEAQYYASSGNKKLGYLSVRQAFECERQGSCEYGGVPHYVFKALKDTGGVSLQYMYPYFEQANTKGDTCQTSKDNVAILIDDYIRLKVDKEEDLLYLLAYYGPVVTTIYVSESIRHYSNGVLDPIDCGNNATNHAVLLDGYGVDNKYNLPYWHVKSTWEGWGYKDHIRLIRGKGFVCNLGREYIATVIVKPNVTQSHSQPTPSVMRKSIPEENSRMEETTLFTMPVRTKGIFEEIKFLP